MIPEPAIDLVQRFEGLHKVGADGLVYPYVCPAGVWTIGFGSTRELDGSPIMGDTPPKTMPQCVELLLREMDANYRQSMWLSPVLQWHPNTKLSAIISFIYNLGWPAYRASTLRRKINTGDWEGAAEQIRKWVFAGGRKLRGLQLRREAEARLLV